MQVGIVTTSYPSTTLPFAGSFVATQVAALRTLGHGVEVVALARGGLALDPSVRLVGPTLASVGLPEQAEAGWRAWPRLGVAAANLLVKTQARASAWDLVLAHWLVPSAVACLPTRGPLVAIAHSGDVALLRRLGLLAATLALLRARGARLVFVSEALQARAARSVPATLARYLERASLITPMGLELARFAAIARARGVRGAPLATVVVVARLVPIKGIDVLLAALQHLRAPLRVVICGDGPMRAALMAMPVPPQHELLWPGMVDAAARDAWLQAASVVVVPSRELAGRSEGTPMIALEALAAGVPVIGSATGGLTALPIVLVPAESPAALATAITRVLAVPPDPVDMAAYDNVAVTQRIIQHGLGP